MEFTAKAVAEFLKGEVFGDPEIKVNKVSKIEEGTEGSLCFLSNPKYEEYLYTSTASIVIVNKDFNPAKKLNCTLIKVEDAYQAIAALLQLQESVKPAKIGKHPQSWIEESSEAGEELYLGAFAYVGENCKLGNKVKIYPQVFVGDNVEIGDNTVIYPGTKIYPDCKIGNNCIIHAGVIIGADGFGFAPDAENDYKKIPQTGNVILEDRVEIGSNTTIDRATIGSTVIRKGVKLDNLIQVGHNVTIGENTVMAAQSAIAGSVKIGKNCMFGGQVGIAGHIEIADEVKMAAKSGVAKDIRKKGAVLMGGPAFDFMDYQKSYVYFKNLPRLADRITSLEKILKNQEKE
jgi:UDP-3-O-[3-hydroxymyristoyl] glucosamine N-acyltransferase